jgi:hypothetical protein
MKYIDVFNGDADGICALIQLRLAEPRQAELITGIKRDIQLLTRVQGGADSNITVLDISLEKNATEVERLLTQGAHINYIDHHQTGNIKQHPNLTTHIDLDANACTSLIIDKLLNGQYRAWAITAAFGDNLLATSTALAQQSGFTEQEIATMKQLGTLLNYNGYGANTDDLFFHPAKLFEKLRDFETPFEFLAHDQTTFQTLAYGYEHDMELAYQAPIIHQTAQTAIIQLPDEIWARRVSGVLGNELANQYPDRAHAVITQKQTGDFLVSVRAPLNRKEGADQLVSQYPTGGGRKAAAGINNLPEEILKQFMAAFELQFSKN